MTERIVRSVEFRAENRTLTGTVLRYGDVSPSHRERFEPGSLTFKDNIWLDYRHDKTRVLAHLADGSLELTDTREALKLRATLPNLPLADIALREVKEGKLSGLSVEFNALEERQDAGIRVVESSILKGVGLVQSPSYEDSRVETRQAGVLFARIPFNSPPLDCECVRGSGSCTAVQFEPGSIQFEDERDILAVWRNFGAPIGSLKKGTLRYESTDKGVEVFVSLPETSWSTDLIEAAKNSPVHARPFFDASDVEYEEIEIDGEPVKRMSRVPTKAILIGSTPNNKNWPEVEITENKRRSSRREMLRWL